MSRQVKLKSVRLHQPTMIDGFGNIGPHISKTLNSKKWTLTLLADLQCVLFECGSAAALIPLMNVVSADVELGEVYGETTSSPAAESDERSE